MRREFSRKLRAQIILRATNERGQIVCEGCGLVLGHKPYEIDHKVPEGLIMNKSTPLTADDGQLLGRDCCHRGGNNKTTHDIRQIRKADRQRDKDTGAMRSKGRGFWRPAGSQFDWSRGRYVRNAQGKE